MPEAVAWFAKAESADRDRGESSCIWFVDPSLDWH